MISPMPFQKPGYQAIMRSTWSTALRSVGLKPQTKGKNRARSAAGNARTARATSTSVAEYQ